LSQLSVHDLLELLAQCRASDAQSAAVLEAYLDRVHGDAWREHTGPDPDSEQRAPHSDGAMSEEQACDILGVPASADHEEVVAAHRRLMQKLHPDRGGSTYLAAMVNQAKDRLLQRR
jgi:DnaJ-domain-containing protein 1